MNRLPAYRVIDCDACGHAHRRAHRARVDMLAHWCSDCPVCDAARVAELRARAPLLWQEVAEVWCDRCPEPTTELVNGRPYCHEHALDAHWKANSPAWNPERTVGR